MKTLLLPLLAAHAALSVIPCTHAADKRGEVAGKADVLRHVPKKFATIIKVTPGEHRIELRLEDGSKDRTWDILPDVELKVHGWWGRLEQFKAGQRVWIWFAVDRKKQPTSVLLMADEISKKYFHEVPGKSNPTQLETLPALQKIQMNFLRGQWRQHGLPGAVTMLHPLGGEMELTLDHEAIQWGRWLKGGDAVTLATPNPIHAIVKTVAPWRERTRLRLVTQSGLDQSDLSLGQRVFVRVPEPPMAIQNSGLPSDIGRLVDKDARIAWMLASSYCSCGITGDKCTGMVYTLASCNVNTCGMPNQIRGKVAKMIDDGMTDEQIWRTLEKERGPLFSRQHLLK